MNFINGLKTTWEQSNSNKILLSILLVFSCCCSIVFCNSFTPTPTPTWGEPSQDVSLIYTKVYLTAQADIFFSFTATAEALPKATQTPISTLTAKPTITFSPEPTSVTNNIIGANCIPVNEFELARVVEIVDGDTIKIYMNDKVYSVRYIGIDTPETGGQYYSLESKLKNSELVLQNEVILIKDVSDKDQYGRLLRYVIANNVFVNYDLVRNGYAKAIAYPPDTSCEEKFNQAQDLAKSSLVGIWKPPTSVPIVNTPSNSGGGGGSNCHPSYPTVCIPPYPPDLDCGDIPYRRFTVLSPDPHRFDRDGDGIGCESN
jgi:micrococcal nuclease